MTARTLLDLLGSLRPGTSLLETEQRIGTLASLQRQLEPSEGPSAVVGLFPEVDVELLCTDGETIEAIRYGPGFAGKVSGVAIGMTGDAVEAVLGPVHRVWPMPHPNYVLLYDTPAFLRIELYRATEQVILILR